jgi:ACS family glucarate transporter-like MFS transporter
MMNGGAFLAPILGPAIVVWAVTNLGWSHVFYICGFLGLIASGIWYFFMRSKPSEHPAVNAAELELITKDGEITEIKEKTP